MRQIESREKRTSTKLVWQVVVVMSLCLTFMGPSASQAFITQTMKAANEPNGMTLEAFHDSGDVDCFEVELPEDGTLTVFTTGDMDTEGGLEDEYSRLAWDDNNGEKGNFLINEPLKAGVYYLIVSGWDANSVGGYYTLGFEFIPYVISQGDDLNNSPLAINEYITIKDSPSDVGDASAYYVEESRTNSGPSSSMMYKDAQDSSDARDTKEDASDSSSDTDGKDRSDTSTEQEQRLVLMAQTGLAAEALESGKTLPEIFDFAASMMFFDGDERLSDPKTWSKVSELGTEAVLADTVRENLEIPEGVAVDAGPWDLLWLADTIERVGGDPRDERWWNDFIGALREKEGIPKGALPDAGVEELLEGLADIQGVGGDPSDINIWDDLAAVGSGDMSPEDFIKKWGSSDDEGQGQGSQDGGNTGSGTSSGTEAPYGDGQPIPGGTSGDSSDDGTGSETPSDGDSETGQGDSGWTVTTEHTDDGGFDLTICNGNRCETQHFVPDGNGGFVNEETGESLEDSKDQPVTNGERPAEGTCTATVDSEGYAEWDCGTETDANADADSNGGTGTDTDSGGDSTRSLDDCFGPYCDDLAEDGLLYEETLPTYNENTVTDPDDPNDGVVYTTPRENIQMDPEDRLAPYINPGETEGDPDESILPVANPEIDQNHNPEPVDPQPQL